MDIDTILLIIGVVGLSISGWVLRGYFIPPASQSDRAADLTSDEPELDDDDDTETARYVTTSDHEEVLKRIDRLEREKQAEVPTVVQSPFPQATPPEPGLAPQPGEPESQNNLNAETWQEVYALQQALKQEREKERGIDYGREETLFDLSQGYDGGGARQGNDDEEETEQRLLDNQLETGEELNAYQQRMTHFASLSREMLVMRIEAADTQLKEQQARHQASLLAIIASLIEKMPGDVNLKSVAQASFVAASAEISDEEGTENRANFQRMFYQSFGQ